MTIILHASMWSAEKLGRGEKVTVSASSIHVNKISSQRGKKEGDSPPILFHQES